MRDDAWGQLHETEAFLYAQRVIAAGFASETSPHGLLDELETLSEWINENAGDRDKVVRRIAQSAAAFSLLAASVFEAFAYEIEKEKLRVAGASDEVEPEREAVRDTMLWLLDQHASRLRAELD
jgi:hypothetical protein